MEKKTYLSAAGTIFAIIAVLHLGRIFYGWSAEIGGWEVPMWLSWAALAGAAYLSWNAFSLKGR